MRQIGVGLLGPLDFDHRGQRCLNFLLDQTPLAPLGPHRWDLEHLEASTDADTENPWVDVNVDRSTANG